MIGCVSEFKKKTLPAFCANKASARRPCGRQEQYDDGLFSNNILTDDVYSKNRGFIRLRITYHSSRELASSITHTDGIF